MPRRPQTVPLLELPPQSDSMWVRTTKNAHHHARQKRGKAPLADDAAGAKQPLMGHAQHP